MQNLVSDAAVARYLSTAQWPVSNTDITMNRDGGSSAGGTGRSEVVVIVLMVMLVGLNW